MASTVLAMGTLGVLAVGEAMGDPEFYIDGMSERRSIQVLIVGNEGRDSIQSA